MEVRGSSKMVYDVSETLLDDSLTHLSINSFIHSTNKHKIYLTEKFSRTWSQGVANELREDVGYGPHVIDEETSPEGVTGLFLWVS